jgi:predicted peptidase
MKRRIFSIITLCLLIATLSTGTVKADTSMLSGSQKVVVSGDDWGPAVIKTVITFDAEVTGSSLAIESFKVREEKELSNGGRGVTDRKILDVYLSDTQGNRVASETGHIVTLEMYVSPLVGSPFVYKTFNEWCAFYELHVSLEDEVELMTSNGSISTIDINPMIDLQDQTQRIVLGADEFALHTYTNDETGRTLSYGEYTSRQANNKRPLVIWLHGGGEGGTDNYITLLGNKVTSLISDDFQSQFDGADIITPQVPTRWMDGVNGQVTTGQVSSVYTKDLMSLISNHVQNNPHIDTDRIIIGGCSNGGYMVMEMILNYPEYFAAAFPICQAFTDAFITDEQIHSLVENEVGIWFVHAIEDRLISSTLCTIPTYERLIAAGATKVHMSTFNNVIDTTGRFVSSDLNGPYEYNAHWVWIYFFNNECYSDTTGENAWVWLSQQTKTVDTGVTDPIPAPEEQPIEVMDTQRPSQNVKTSDAIDTLLFELILVLSFLTFAWNVKQRTDRL